jgi:hypothetical protein
MYTAFELSFILTTQKFELAEQSAFSWKNLPSGFPYSRLRSAGLN